MESLSRPPHRRKPSTTATTTANIFSSSISFKNSYDDVLLLNGGGRKQLEVHEYSEIFSGSSSIPVLDLSGLDERAGPGDFSNSMLDYSNIFGGLRNDDVFVPYEELLNGAAKKTKPRIPAELQPDLQGLGSLSSSGKAKWSSGEASDQSVGVKQQFNMSFNRNNQINGDALDGETHITQLNAVAGFTHFVDGTPRLHKIKDGKLPSLKREVSRTWSFSAEVEPVKDKGGSSLEKSQIPGKSHNVNEVNLKSQFSKLSGTKDPSQPRVSNFASKEDASQKIASGNKDPSQPRVSNFASKEDASQKIASGNKDPSQPRVSSFASKEDASQKIASECSSTLFGEEFDENSVDAVSAAALKKAIDQAQESIRIAKMIMERKKEGYQDGSKPRPIVYQKDSDKETKIDREVYGSKYNNARENYEELDPLFTVRSGIDGKFSPSLSHSNSIINAANSEVERVSKNVEADKEHGVALAGGGKLFASDCNQNETLHIDENIKLEKLEENYKAAKTHNEATLEENIKAAKMHNEAIGLVANSVCRTVDLEPGEVGKTNNLMPSMCKPVSNLGGFETGKENFEWREATVHHSKGSEVVPEVVETAASTSQGTQAMETSVEENEFCQATLDHAKGPENVERVLSTSQKSPQHNKVVNEVGENLSICQEGEVNKQRENDINDKEKHETKLEQCEKVLNAEDLVLRSELNNVLNESCILAGNESVEQEEMEKNSENVTEWKGNGYKPVKIYHEEISEMRPEEADLWFEIKEQLKEALLEEINEMEPCVSPEIGEVEKNVDEAHEQEIDDKKQNCADDGHDPKLAEDLMQNIVEEGHISTCEYEAAETIMMEADQYAAVQKRTAYRDGEETDNTPEGAGRSEHNQNKCQFQEAAYEEGIDETVDLSSSGSSPIFDDTHTNDTSTIACETQEACDVDLNNRAEEHQKDVKNYKDDDIVPEVNQRVAIDKDKKTEPLFHLQDNEMVGTDSLRRSASEEIFVENKLHDAFEGLSSNGKTETVGVIDADHEENLPKDVYVSRETSDIHDAAQEYAAEIDKQNSPEVLASDVRTAEFDLKDVRQVLEPTSESDEGSVSASGFENIDGLPTHESEECAENVKDMSHMTSEKEELKDEPEMVSDKRKCAEELNEDLNTKLYSEPKQMDKPMETERAVEGLNKEKNKDNDNLTGTSPMEERDVKEGVQNFESNDQQQRIEAIKRGREREKDRIAVERAIREARERAFAEARERAERAAMERAAVEVQQRATAEAQDKVEKASVVKQPVDKASAEVKLRAERAAVERATAEARERALEKVMSQKIGAEARTPADRHPTERFSSSSRNNGLKHSFSSSDLESGMNTESAQRRKARLERHQRIMERAAKALAEKNMRDLLAQKEQAERNRLAESLDADIKRWAMGKEGNLRALLSTLQYILGPDSGWQPISLTEIITTAAVKKAYRKATLCVHPDKLQQRGASVQQKYICEKVFDLLKAAWNKFNSDER